MKIMNTLMANLLICAALVAQFDCVAKGGVKTPQQNVAATMTSETPEVSADVEEIILTANAEAVQKAIDEFQTIETAANIAKENAEKQLQAGEINQAQCDAVLFAQDYKVELAKKRLEVLTTQSIDEVEAVEEGYMSRLMSGAQSLVSYISSGIQGLGRGTIRYTPQQIETAKVVMAGLRNELDEITADYNAQMETVGEQEKIKLTDDYNKIRQEFDAEMALQQSIVGFDKKLFWGVVGTAGALIAGGAAKSYLGAPVVTPPYMGTRPGQLETEKHSTIEELERAWSDEKNKQIRELRDEQLQGKQPTKIKSATTTPTTIPKKPLIKKPTLTEKAAKAKKDAEDKKKEEQEAAKKLEQQKLEVKQLKKEEKEAVKKLTLTQRAEKAKEGAEAKKAQERKNIGRK